LNTRFTEIIAFTYKERSPVNFILYIWKSNGTSGS
jgi:hypothetical protein